MSDSKLKEFIPERLVEGLTEAESLLLDKVQTGEFLNLQIDNPEINDPDNADKWGSERIIRAEFLRWICTNRKICEHIDAKGIQIVGAKIDGKLDLEGATILHRLSFFLCSIKEEIVLIDAQTRSIHFDGTHVGPIVGDRVAVNGVIFFRNKFRAKGEIRLLGAKIGGNFDCSGGSFENATSIAIAADGIETKGNIFLNDGFNARGEVRLLGAKINGALYCNGGSFQHNDGFALNADGIETKGDIFLNDGFNSLGEVRLIGAKINGTLYCNGGSFQHNDGFALNADGIETKGDIFLNDGFNSLGEVRLFGAKVSGDLYCKGGSFQHDGYALNASGIETKANIFLNDGFNARGEVRLIGAKVGALFCRGGSFENLNGKALMAQKMTVIGNFTWPLKRPIGKIDLMHAKVGVLTDNEKSWPAPGKLLIDGFEYDALAPDKTPKDAKRRLNWIELQYPPKNMPITMTEPLQNKFYFKSIWSPSIDLLRTSYAFNKIKESVLNIWKEINGFNLYSDFKNRPEFKYRPQPYEQLAKVLKNMGHESDSREVLIAKQEALRKKGGLRRPRKVWHWFLGFTMGHGYKPMMPILSILLMIILGSILFNYAYANTLITQSKPNVFRDNMHLYPEFNPIVYSIDTLIPFVDLHQENYWIPFHNSNYSRSSTFIHIYLWLHIIIGWVFTTFAAVSLSGIVRKKE